MRKIIKSQVSKKQMDREAELLELQTRLVEAQVKSLQDGRKLLILFEGRDGAGKDGAIKRITEFLSVRHTHVIALNKPDEVERTQWYFQRYVAHLPGASDWVLFNRSWYNRIGVEKVMGFSTPEQQARFIDEVTDFESLLVRSGIHLIKFWLDISKAEQATRLEARQTDPLKQLKISDLDAYAQPRWKAYSEARDTLLAETHSEAGRWICVKTDTKMKARLNIMRHILKCIADQNIDAIHPDLETNDEILFDYDLVREGKRTLFV